MIKVVDLAVIQRKIISYFLARPSAKVRIMVEEGGSHVHEMSSYFWKEGGREAAMDGEILLEAKSGGILHRYGGREGERRHNEEYLAR